MPKHTLLDPNNIERQAEELVNNSATRSWEKMSCSWDHSLIP